MSRRRRLIAVTLVALCSATLLTGCKKLNSDKDHVVGFINATIKQPRAFTYVDNDRKKTMTVVGVIADAFRYKARLSVDSTPSWEEVASDDTVADRFDDPHLLVAAASKLLGQADKSVLARSATVLDNAPPPVKQGTTINPVDVLRTGRWLVDPVGAPNIYGASVNQGRHQGDDPIYDAVSVLSYVRDVVVAAPRVIKYDPEALSHPYKPTEDPFPTPVKGSGIDRYDVALRPLPQKSSTGQGAAVTIASFRKMAIYVQHGVVTEVRESVDVLNELAAFARNEQFPVPAGLTADQQIDLATQQFDKLVGLAGEPLRVRTMTLQLLDIGKPEDVALPTDNIVIGTASVLPYQGKIGATTQSGSSGAGVGFTGGSLTTTVSSAPTSPSTTTP